MQSFRITTFHGPVFIGVHSIRHWRSENVGAGVTLNLIVIDPAFKHRKWNGKPTRMTRPAYAAFSFYSGELHRAHTWTYLGEKMRKLEDGTEEEREPARQWWDLLPAETVEAITAVVGERFDEILAAGAPPTFESPAYAAWDPID